MKKYPITVSNFSNGVNIPRLKREMSLTAIKMGLIDIKDFTNRIDVEFEDVLGVSDKSAFNTLLDNHDGAPNPDSALNNLTATTNPTVNDDINAGYSRLSFWINTVLKKLFVLVDPTQFNAVWVNIPGTDLTERLHLSSQNIIGSAWEKYESFLFLGTGTHAISSIKFIGRFSGDPMTQDYSVKVVDKSNGDTIIATANFTNDTNEINDLGTIISLDVDPSMMDIEAKANAAGKNVVIDAVLISF